MYFIIDALDECAEEGQTRKSLLEPLLGLSCKICLFVTSRDIPNLHQQPGGATRVDIKASDKDIGNYIEDRIPRTERLKT